jgi:hypothetical protein
MVKVTIEAPSEVAGNLVQMFESEPLDDVSGRGRSRRLSEEGARLSNSSTGSGLPGRRETDPRRSDFLRLPREDELPQAPGSGHRIRRSSERVTLV